MYVLLKIHINFWFFNSHLLTLIFHQFNPTESFMYVTDWKPKMLKMVVNRCIFILNRMPQNVRYTFFFFVSYKPDFKIISVGRGEFILKLSLLLKYINREYLKNNNLKCDVQNFCQYEISSLCGPMNKVLDFYASDHIL